MYSVTVEGGEIYTAMGEKWNVYTMCQMSTAMCLKGGFYTVKDGI